MYGEQRGGFKGIIGGIIGLVIFIGLLWLGFHIVETNKAGHYQIKQAAVSGTMSAITKPGWFGQWWGDVFDYHQADTFSFTQERDSENKLIVGTSISVRFNDGATAFVNGSVRFELPPNADKLIALHRKFRGYENLMHSGIQPLVGEAVILTAALMSAEESYTTKRSRFAEMAWDQVTNGVYITEQADEAVEESRVEIGQEKARRIIVRVKTTKDGQPVRRQNPLAEYGVRLSQFVIKEIDYEGTVDDRIKKKQEALMATVQARAEAERAMQQRITAEEEGKKNVAVAEYGALVAKKTAVVDAERNKEVGELEGRKKLEVARLATQEAAEYKRATLLRAEADAEAARRLYMADGALKEKLAAWLDAQKAWADAAARSPHRLVPDVVFGGNSGGSGNAALDLMGIIGIQAARQLALDLRMGGGGGAPVRPAPLAGVPGR